MFSSKLDIRLEISVVSTNLNKTNVYVKNGKSTLVWVDYVTRKVPTISLCIGQGKKNGPIEMSWLSLLTNDETGFIYIRAEYILIRPLNTCSNLHYLFANIYRCFIGYKFQCIRV